MLSAVAARKARLAPQKSSVLVQSPCPPSPKSTQDSPLPSKPTSKRKSSSAAATSSSTKKKRKKDGKIDERKSLEGGRYFARKAVTVDKEEDAIIIDQDDSEPTPLEEDLSEPAPPQPVLRPPKRAWSPSRLVRDSSDEEVASTSEDEAVVAHTPIPGPSHIETKQQPAVLSSFHPIPNQNTFAITPSEAHMLGLPSEEGSTLLVLGVDETLCLVGTYSLTVLKGVLSLSGVNLRPSLVSHRVFAPRCTPLPVLRPSPADCSTKVEIDIDINSRLHGFFQQDATLILIQPLHTGVDGLGRICRTFDRMFTCGTSLTIDLDIPGVQMIAHEGRGVCPFSVPKDWEEALSTAVPVSSDDNATAEPAVYLVKGAKKTGKSTFARTLVNRLLAKYQRVAFLETDVGQSEFTPGGLVALNIVEQPLFGPPFTHPSLPHRAHYIGSTSPRSSPSHYIASIQDLIQSYRLDVQFPLSAINDESDTRIADVVPLVVNTMGWTKGLGTDLTRRIEEMLEPQRVFNFSDPWAAQEELLTEPGPNTCALQPCPPSSLSTAYSAADFRALSILSYFHSSFPSSPSDSMSLRQVTATAWRTSLPLCAIPPFEVTPSLALDQVVLIGAGMEDVVPTEIQRVLNGAVVGLVSCEPGTVDCEDVPGGIPYTQGAAPPLPATSACHGIALIRAISPPASATPIMHILTPSPPRDARVFVKGELELPVWGMLDFRQADGSVAGVERGQVPFLRWGKGEGVGGEKRRVRRNLMRKGQM